MSRRRCCCSKCYCGETKITADGTVTWISHTVADGVITRVNNSARCKTYYVDSVSGGGAESGSGTELDPWTNLNTVFSNDCIYAICTHAASPDKCPMVKVLVKGTIDYATTGNSLLNYGRNLVIEPWGGGPIVINISGTGVIYAVRWIVGCVWKTTNVTVYGTGNPTVGFYQCTASTFDTCNATGNGTGNSGDSYGFIGCGSSTFDTTSGTGNCNGSTYGCGYYNCTYSTFHDCIGTGYSTNGYFGISYSWGYWDCFNSTFDACNAYGTTDSARLNGYGFGGCSSSIFTSCTAIGDGPTHGYGFYACTASTFDTCSGTGTGTGTNCGFYGNTSSSYIDCTASPSGAPCDI